jgi:hypothetical protein
MKKILVVYNISGIIHERIDMWFQFLLPIINQNYKNFDVCISGCKISKETQNKFIEFKKSVSKKVHLIFYDEVHPVNVTFNKTCIELSKYEFYDAFMYVASDVNFIEHLDALSKLTDLHFNENCGITSVVVNNDSGIIPWLGENVYNNILNESHYQVPIGKTCNMHCMLFDRKFLDYYGKIIPDIFRSYCTESTFSFLTSSIEKKFIIHNKDIILIHLHSSDGSSGGFQGNRGWKDLYKSSRNVMDRLMTNDAWICGFGYEECQNIFPHNKDMYDEYGIHKNPKLLVEFIKENLYLNKIELNYDTINVTYYE